VAAPSAGTISGVQRTVGHGGHVFELRGVIRMCAYPVDARRDQNDGLRIEAFIYLI
jgi:hypothetical protein